MSALTHFPLKLGCEGYPFLDQAAADFEHALDSILTDSIDMPELDASFDEADTMPSSVASRFLHSFSAISDNSRLQIA